MPSFKYLFYSSLAPVAFWSSTNAQPLHSSILCFAPYNYVDEKCIDKI